ncbi:MAG: phosphoglucosamine mutase, partial [Verrucomicrobiota bacterium]
MGLKYFGTDGIRGRVGGQVLNEASLRRLGYALGAYGDAIAAGKPLAVVIGFDTRESSPWISEVLIEGLNEHHGYIFNVGVVPTPAVALSVLEHQATFGIVITASHNPSSDNGIKLFNAQGTKLSEAEEAAIEALFEKIPEKAPRPDLRRSSPVDGLGAYITHVRSMMHQQCFANLRIVVDCSHGATSISTPAVLRHFGAEVIVLNDTPNGKNINDGVGSENPSGLAERVLQEKANLGIAHDGDGDRVIFCNEGGEVVDGDQILGILALDRIKRNALEGNTLVATVQSNLGLDSRILAAGGVVVREDVGDRNVAAKMRELDAQLGGENSGHIILSERSTTGDGLIAAIEVIRIICESGKSLSSLAAEIILFPQETHSLRVEQKVPLESLSCLKEDIVRQERSLGKFGRILIRYSGTEPKLRFLVEAKTSTKAAEILQSLIENAKLDFA